MNRKLRILFLQSQSYFGSDSKMHSLLMRHYDREQTEVYVACNQGTRSGPAPSLTALKLIPDLHVRPVNFGPTLFSVPKREVARSVPSMIPLGADLARLAGFVKRHRIDVIHTTEKPRDALYGLLLARLTGACNVVHLHVKCENWINPAVRRAMAHSDGLIAVSQFVADSAIAMGYRPEKIHVLLNSVDASEWDPATDGTAVRAEYNIGPDQPVLAIISRLYHWKGHIDLVNALARVRQDCPAVRLLIVGEDDERATPDRGSLTAELKALVASLDLTENVIFTGFRTDVAALLAACDVYTMPTIEEPCAVAFLEAMAMAKPVVALRSGGTPEIVPDGKAGLLSDPGDVEGLAANISRLIGDRNLRRELGEFGRHWIETCLTPPRMAATGLDVYRRIVGQSTLVEA